MNKKPITYYQTDRRWAKTPYRVPGEDSTIGDSGCGPTAAAMLIETMTGKAFTPVDACKWSVEHGYKAKHQGTYYAYFTPQFKAFGIQCTQLNWKSLYSDPNNRMHDIALNYLKEGYYLIALMGKGLWTSGGHFVVVWWADKDTVYINDPASTKKERVIGDLKTFKSQCKYYWVIDAREFNRGEDMTEDKVKEIARGTVESYLAELKSLPPSGWSKEAREFAESLKLVQGDETGKMGYRGFVTKEELMTILERLYHLLWN